MMHSQVLSDFETSRIAQTGNEKSGCARVQKQLCIQGQSLLMSLFPSQDASYSARCSLAWRL